MGNDLLDTMVGGAIGILAIHEVGEMVQGRRRKTAPKRTTKGKGKVNSRQVGKSTSHATTKRSVGNRVVHKGVRGGKYIIRHGNRVYV